MKQTCPVVVGLFSLVLVACHSHPPVRGEGGGEVTKGIDSEVIPETVMMPAWEGLIQHTRISPPGKATHPCSSQDGTFFVYSSTETSVTPQIFLRETDGVVPTQLTNNRAENIFPRISPNGKKVAFSSNVSGNWDIYVLRLDAPASWLTVTSGPRDEIAPSWSPDGKKLVYSSKSERGYWRLVIVDVATGIPTFLGAGLYPDWSPHPDSADQWIAFQSQSQNGMKGSIWIVRPDGSGLRELVADRHREWSAVNPRWAPDGKWISYATVKRSPESVAYGQAGEADDLWVVMSDGRYDTRITDDLSPEWWPAWSADRLLFVSKREGIQNIFSVRPRPLVD